LKNVIINVGIRIKILTVSSVNSSRVIGSRSIVTFSSSKKEEEEVSSEEVGSNWKSSRFNSGTTDCD